MSRSSASPACTGSMQQIGPRNHPNQLLRKKWGRTGGEEGGAQSVLAQTPFSARVRPWPRLTWDRDSRILKGSREGQDLPPSAMPTPAHKALLSKKEQHELGIDKSIPCTSCLSGGPSRALLPQCNDLLLHLCKLHRDPWSWETFLLQMSLLPPPVPPLHTLLL